MIYILSNTYVYHNYQNNILKYKTNNLNSIYDYINYYDYKCNSNNDNHNNRILISKYMIALYNTTIYINSTNIYINSTNIMFYIITNNNINYYRILCTELNYTSGIIIQISLYQKYNSQQQMLILSDG